MRSACCNQIDTLNGVGLGLRGPHINHILHNQPSVNWFELLADNHMVAGGWARQQAIEIANRYPVTMHCVGMSIGSTDRLNIDYLNRIKFLANDIKPKLISDHLCWTSWQGLQSHDLLPLPFTEEALQHVVDRIGKIQDTLGCQIAIENISSYVAFQHSVIEEVDFINAVAQQADCYILLDINNIYVNHYNNQVDPYQYLDKIDTSRVAELHLAGFEDKGDYLLDTHNCKVHSNVWNLYEHFIRNSGGIPTLIEWDHAIPDFETVNAEAIKAEQFHAKLTHASPLV